MAQSPASVIRDANPASFVGGDLDAIGEFCNSKSRSSRKATAAGDHGSRGATAAREEGVTRTLLAASLAALVAVAGACSDTHTTSSPPWTVRDSAGVRIVESMTAVWDSSKAWRVGPQPVLEVGQGLDLEHVAAVLRLSDGRIAIAETGDNSIIVFAPDGRVLTRFGRKGSGPGEFRDISRVRRFRGTDSLLVYDLLLNRGSVFEPDGRLVREFSTMNARGRVLPTIAGVFDDGSLLMADLAVPTPDTRGLVRDDVTLRRYDPATDRSTPLATFAGREVYFQDTPWGQVDMRRPYYGKAAAWATGGDRVFWAISDTFAIHALDEQGTPLSVYRIDREPARPTAADVDRLITRQLETVQDENARREARRMLESMPVADRAPAFGWPSWSGSQGPELQLDEEGNLWVVEFDASGSGRNARYVFGVEGEWLGTVELPARFSPGQIGDDYIIGVSTDSLDVEHVQEFRLIKP